MNSRERLIPDLFFDLEGALLAENALPRMIVCYRCKCRCADRSRSRRCLTGLESALVDGVRLVVVAGFWRAFAWSALFTRQSIGSGSVRIVNAGNRGGAVRVESKSLNEQSD
jgi:hypothetical protein